MSSVATVRVVSGLLMAALGCGGDDPPEPEPPFVFPLKAHSGFDGTHAFKVPLITNLEPDPVWTLADPSIGTLQAVQSPPEWEATGGSWALITTLKPGVTELSATVGTVTASTTLTVTAYTAADVAIGETRYREPADAGPNRVPCASCHEKEDGADHSPVRAAMYDDAGLLTIIKTGELAGEITLRVPHKWDITAAEQKGIVAYLRSLPPRGFE